MKIIKYITSRLKERSTWIGLISFVTALGVSLSPEQSQAIVSAGVALASVVAVFSTDKKL